jgi:hypothetical protein
MPGCSLKEAFPGFIKDVNENPNINDGVQRFGVQVFDPHTSQGTPMIETFSPYTNENNVGQFDSILPDIEKLLENDVSNTEGVFSSIPNENNYLFDRIPRDEYEEDDIVDLSPSKPRHLSHLSQQSINHIKKCKTCRQKLQTLLPTTVIRENIRPMDQLIELSTFLATGIFIILILDIMSKNQRF